MSLTMHIYNKTDGGVDGFDVSELAHSIEYTTSILGKPGKLTFILEKDPNNILSVGVGSLVKFWHSDNEKDAEKPIFSGNVFTIGTDRTEAYRVVAYDQMRYLQNHENKLIPDDENDLEYYFNEICSQYKFKNKVAGWKKYLKNYNNIRGENFVDVSAFDILQYCMNDYAMNNMLKITATNFNYTGFSETNELMKGSFFHPKFYLRDNFGTLELREIFTDFVYNENGEERKEFLVIGDESLLTDYQYEIDIDKDTYNEFYIMGNKKGDSGEQADTNEKNDKTLVFAIQAGSPISGTNTSLDGKTIGKNTIPDWGILRRIITVNTTELDSGLYYYIEELVNLSNHPSRSMKLSALGVDGVCAGSSFVFSLKKLNISYPAYVISATHYYDGDLHKMDLEINTNPTIGGMM